MLTPACRTRAELQSIIGEWKRDGLTVGFVPTMGALHTGHLSLIKIARERCDRVVASIFVNPTQFAAHEDLDTYPRHEEDDRAKLAAYGCDLAYCPSVEELYPVGAQTEVSLPALGALLEGQFRPHFFGGVATVVSRLFVHVTPDVAVFGEKDYQQLVIIKQMTKDFGFPTEIIGGPTGRELSGLAQSSRNAYLSADWKPVVPALAAILHRASKRVTIGTDIKTALDEARSSLSDAGFSSVDYLNVCDAETLEAIEVGNSSDDRPLRILAAVWAGQTRLIDNMAIG